MQTQCRECQKKQIRDYLEQNMTKRLCNVDMACTPCSSGWGWARLRRGRWAGWRDRDREFKAGAAGDALWAQLHRSVHLHSPGLCELCLGCPRWMAPTILSCPAAVSLLAQGLVGSLGWSWPLGLRQCFLRIANEFCALSCWRFHLRFTANNSERCQRATFQFLAK